jgi:hypothetical protein
MTRALRGVLAAAAVVLGACGSSPSSPSGSPTAAVPATATPSPTSAAPDTERVDVVASGIGVYLITVIPVAVLHNAATSHAATMVQVRFTVLDSAGHPREATTRTLPFIAPGQTMAIAARVEDSGNLRATATVIGAQWESASPTPPLTVQGARYACGSCGPGAGYGTASGTLTAAPGVSVSSVSLTAVCTDARGGIVGASDSTPVAVTTLPRPVQAAVIVIAPPARCDLYATPTS